MLQKGVSSFVFLWVLNPIVILFYQNCSWVPAQRAVASQEIKIETAHRIAKARAGSEEASSCVGSGNESKQICER